MKLNNRKSSKFKVLSLLVVALMLIILTVACSNNGDTNNASNKGDATTPPASSVDQPEEEAPESNGLLVDKETTLQILMEEHASFPVKTYEQSPFTQHVKDVTNIKLDIIPVPDSGDAYKQKLNIILNSSDLPDIIWNSKDDANINSLATKGMFLSYDDYLDELPNIKAALAQFPELRKTISAEDGKLYIMPRLMYDNMTELFLFRKDILDAEGMEAPKSYDELYLTLKALKEKHPDMIAWVNRWGSEHMINRMGYSWGTGFEPSTQGFYLNKEQNRYVYGPSESNFKDMIVWLKKLYDENLLDKEYALRTTQQWEEAFFNEKAIFTIDFIARVEQVNNKYIQNNSSARIAAVPPVVGPTGLSGIYGRSSVLPNSGIAVTADAENPLAAFKFVDWVFSEEGRLISRYGIENESFIRNDDGTVSMTPDMQSTSNPNGKELVKDFGWIYYLNKYEFPVDHIKSENQTDENLYFYSRKVMEEANGIVEPDPTLSFKDDQKDIIRNKGTSISDYFKENIDKFIMGARPITEWEQFIEELNKRGLGEVGEVYNAAYQAYLTK
jgi:putative aldouronate transport system substrate-binding protein